MTTSSKIFIITPTFNAAATIATCIESVASQTYTNKEHWIIDGLSTDNMLEIVRQYAAIYPHIRSISRKINMWNEQQITRYNKKYSRIEIQDLIIFGYPKLFTNQFLLIQVHLELIYRIYQFFKNLIKKIHRWHV